MSWQKRHGIMLCQPLDEHNLDRNFKLAKKMLVQPKLDGMRAWVDWVDGEPVLVSSQGHTIDGLPHINLALKELRRLCNNHQENFDGEIYSHGLSFEDIISRAKRTTERHPDYATLQYHIFDYKAALPQGIRTDYLEKLKALWDEKAEGDLHFALNFVPTIAATRGQISEYLDRFVRDGYEGIIVRNPLAGYVETRPFTILKWKPSKKDWYRIEAVEEAISEAGTPLGRVGAFVCCDRYGNTFKCGPGLGATHFVASELWQKREELIGQYAEVYYQNLTTKGVPRFGKFSLAITPSKTSGE